MAKFFDFLSEKYFELYCSESLFIKTKVIVFYNLQIILEKQKVKL